MDRALKERIIGAIVLVLFVVLVVPVFLDGPPGEPGIVSERVPLPGQEDQELRTVVLDRDRTQPVPAAVAEPSGGVESQAGADTPRPASRPEADPVAPPPATEPPQQTATRAQVEESPAATVSTTGMWAVQLGSFGNEANAERLAADLRKQGFAAFLSELNTAEGALHRVRVGPQKDREDAEAMAERLGRAGHKGQVVPHP